MTRICPRCGSDIPADHRLCPVCLFGEALRSEIVHCPKCQAEIADGARFCSECGTAAPSTTTEGDPIRTALEAKLQGQYRIIRQLGRGGMGCVYLARDLTLEREVAIKVVNTEDHTREMYDRFRRETKTAAKLSHPNIVPLHAFGEVEGMPYFVMGYVRGESLADRLRREGKLPEGDARRIFAEIADALDHAHRQGVVHRDIKPDNVLLEDESGRALLTDFGVAKAAGTADTMTVSGSVVGTPHYMSPEQASGRSNIDGRSDLYSLGVMAYTALTGRLPFEGQTAAEILSKHMTQAPVSLRSVEPAISDSTVQAVERCLAKDPAQRWPDARSLELALGVVEESPLPDALHAVEGKGLPALLITLALELLYVFIGLRPLWFLEIWLAVFFAFAYAFVVFRLRGEGFSPSESQRAMWREPTWWLWWYPRGLRRRGNAWHRLPPTVRRLRWSTLAFLGVACWIYVDLALGKILFGRPEPRFSFGHGDLLDTRGNWPRLGDSRAVMSMGVFIVIVAAWIFFTLRSRRMLGHAGLNKGDINRVVLTVPPGRASFWSRPHIEAILAPEKKAETQPATPHDQLLSIIRDANELSGPLRPLGTECAVAGRQLLASIETIEHEIATLSRSVEPGEEERLADKIATLGSESEPLRLLLEKQLDLIRDLGARIEEAKEKRGRHIEMLKTLALHVASLRARSSQTPSEIRMISDRVRALCEDIAGRDHPEAEVRATLRK